MRKHLPDLLLTLLAAVLLLGYAAAMPSPAITDEAREAYMNESYSEDDEYAFLFD